MSANRTKRFRIERLERREMFSAVSVESEPNDRKSKADHVAFDPADNAAEVSGQIAGSRDRDFFRFTATVATTVGLEIQSGPGLVGKVSVEDRFGNKLFETEPHDGVNAGTFEVDAGQTIFVRVRGKDHTSGAYTLQLSLDGPIGGGGGGGGSEPGNLLVETEPNDRQFSANLADLGGDGILRLEGTSTSDRDKDFFRFTSRTNGTLNVAVSSSNGNHAQLEIEDAQGNELFETEPNDGINAGSVQVVAGQSYFIRLRSKSGAAAPYMVDLALS